MRTEIFDCANTSGNKVEISDPLLAGAYNVRVTAIDTQDRAMGPATLANVRVTAPNGYADLLDVEVDVGNTN
jgi:hypothetical protein